MIRRLLTYADLRRAQHRFNQGKIESATDLLRAIVKRMPEYHFAYFHLASMLARLQKWDEAIVELEKAIACKPQKALYHSLLGRILYYKGAFAQAQETLRHSLQLDGNNLLSHNYLALCYLAQNDVKQYQDILREKGIFESSEMHLHILLALERYRHQQSTRQPEKSHELDNTTAAEQRM